MVTGDTNEKLLHWKPIRSQRLELKISSDFNRNNFIKFWSMYVEHSCIHKKFFWKSCWAMKSVEYVNHERLPRIKNLLKFLVSCFNNTWYQISLDFEEFWRISNIVLHSVIIIILCNQRKLKFNPSSFSNVML